MQKIPGAARWMLAQCQKTAGCALVFVFVHGVHNQILLAFKLPVLKDTALKILTTHLF